MQGQIIKTYSKKKPVDVFKSATALVPCYPDPNVLNVRESRLNDKTLTIAEQLESTFDRLAKGVVIPSRVYSSDSSDNEFGIFKNTSDTEENAKTNNDKQDHKILDQEKITDYGKLTQRKNKNKVVAKKTSGLKRKKNDDGSSSDEDLDANPQIDEHKNSEDVDEFIKPKSKIRKFTKKKKVSPVEEKIDSYFKRSTVLENADNVEVTNKNNQDDSLLETNDTSLIITEGVSKSRENPHIHQLKINNLPTSTPRDKLPLIVNMKNISPINFDKENRENVSMNTTISSIGAEDQQPKEAIQKESDFIKPKSTLVVRQDTKSFSESNALKNKVVDIEISDIENETLVSKDIIDNKNNLNHSEPLVNSTIMKETTPKKKSLLEQIPDIQLNTDNELLNVSPIPNRQKNDLRSFMESPLLFDDTHDNYNEKSKNSLCLQNKVDKDSQNIKNLFEKSMETDKKEKNKDIHTHNESDNLNESSYYPHDWTNDYNSSYDYFIEKPPIEHDVSKESEVNNLKEKESSAFLAENVTDENNDSKITENENIVDSESKDNSTMNHNKLSSENVVPEITNQINDDDKLSECEASIIKENVNESVKMVESPINEELEEQISLHLSNSTQDSVHMNIDEYPDKIEEPVLHETVNAEEMPINDQNVGSINNIQDTEDSNAVDLKLEDQNTTNEVKQVLEENENKSESEESSSTKNNIIHDIQNVPKSLYMDEDMDNRDEFVHSKSNKNTVDISNQNDNSRSDKIKEIDKLLNGKQLTLCLTRLNDKYIYAKSPVLSRDKKQKVVKESIGKPKPVKSSKKIEIRKKDKKTEINHENKNIETKNMEKFSFKNNSNNDKEIIEKLKMKELRVVVERLKIANLEKESPILSRRNIRRKTIKSGIRKSRSVAENKNKENSASVSDELDTITKSNFNNTEKRKRSSIDDQRIDSDSKVNKTLEDEDINLKDKSKNNTGTNGQELQILLSKLNDPVKITMKRNAYKKWNKPLKAITEDQVHQFSNIIYEEEEKEKEDEGEEENTAKQASSKKKNSDINEAAYKGRSSTEEQEANNGIENRKSSSVFLKPGKSWARSLSIISHFHSGQNLEELAIGRGKNWRHSVQAVLNMQPDAALQYNTINTVKEYNEKKRPSRSSTNSDALERESNRVSSIASRPRSSHRFSVRIIPSGQRSTLTDDFMYSVRGSSISNRTRNTSIRKKTSLSIRGDTLIETEDDLIKSAKDIILKRCKQTNYVPFSECFPDEYIDHCRKIGEGVYGEVFMYAKDDQKSVIKIIPIEGDQLVNCEPQKKFHEILSEIIISEELHKLRFKKDYNTNGFVGVNRIMCVIGRYPDKLIDLWKIYDLQKKSENDCPSMFNDKQLYIVLDLVHGGQDLEAYVFQNASESYSIFVQTAYTLAVAEQSLEFEHRDLHWGNILISKTDEANTNYKLDNKEISLATKGVAVSVIDFTLSRLSYQGCKIFNDLAADPTLFTAQGEYQFDIYRMMRDKVDNDWQEFSPFTNILWLDYTLDKMITQARYKKKTTKVHKTAIQKMKELRKEILNYESTFDFVNNCDKIEL